MLAALIAGQSDPVPLADLAVGTWRGKIPQLRRALEGWLREPHRFLLKRLLAQWRFVESETEWIDQRLEQIGKEETKIAEAVAGWLRDEAAPRVEKIGAALKAVETFDDFECRGRNRAAGAKLSEHGKGNAIDLRSFILADGRAFGLTDVKVAKDFREDIRESACHRFTTVLGPGSDSQHDSHIHLDLIERRQGFRMCQWDVREQAVTEIVAPVRLPTPRPAITDKRPRHTRNWL